MLEQIPLYVSHISSGLNKQVTENISTLKPIYLLTECMGKVNDDFHRNIGLYGWGNLLYM